MPTQHTPPDAPLAESKTKGYLAALRWVGLITLACMTGLALLLFFLLNLTTGSQTFYEKNFQWLFAVNIGVLLILGGSILWLAVQLLRQIKHKRFGSRLLLKLVLVIGLVGVLPGVLIYMVSYQFVSRSIESWFDTRVESALISGLSLGRTALDTMSNDLANKTRLAADELARLPEGSAALALERLREQLQASDIILWSASGKALASAGESRFEISPQSPGQAQLRAARAARVFTQIDGLEDSNDGHANAGQRQARIKVIALVNTPAFGLGIESRYLQVVSLLPPALVADALAVQVANQEYQERALGRQGLRKMYIGTLTLALFFAVFGAVLLAVLLGNQLLRPLLVLAEGMRDVAAGNLSPKLTLSAKDELSSLTRTFAHMTQDLAQARSAVQHSMAQLNATRDNLQTILDNLSAGVVVLDQHHVIQSVNPGAARTLRMEMAQYVGQPLSEVPGLGRLASGVLGQFAAFLSQDLQHRPDHWQGSFELHPSEGQPSHASLTLIARGALLPNSEYLLVVDDVSEMVSAQRAQAWAEVARRLAHEIKNPLTPIQLSAERLAIKLKGKLEATEQTLLNKSVHTIVEQVDAMKRLVNEFGHYARLPAAQLVPTDLNAVVRDILCLYDHNPMAPVLYEPAHACPPILGDAQQIRQIVHNLVQNAQDAVATRVQGQVRIHTQIAESAQWVRLCVTDNGPGFAPHILKRAFEPYVTTKVKGTGLGLAVVKKIMGEHGGRVDLSNLLDGEHIRGAQVSLLFKTAH